ILLISVATNVPLAVISFATMSPSAAMFPVLCISDAVIIPLAVTLLAVISGSAAEAVLIKDKAAKLITIDLIDFVLVFDLAISDTATHAPKDPFHTTLYILFITNTRYSHNCKKLTN